MRRNGFYTPLATVTQPMLGNIWNRNHSFVIEKAHQPLPLPPDFEDFHSGITNRPVS